jgi:hypothetical protein
LSSGVRSAIPVIVFWTIVGLRSVLASSIDRRGAWLFRVIIGRPNIDHLTGTRIWVTLWAGVIGLATAIVLQALSPNSLQCRITAMSQLLVATGTSFLLTNLFLFSFRTIPFTHVRKSSITDLPLAIVRYFVLFPLFVAVVVHYETWIEASASHLLTTLLFLVAVHLMTLKAYTRSLEQSTLDTPLDDVDEFPQRLGLRDT